ncbi:hypothetical protein FB451DRAFT_1341070 [Mycena latifolia]|nr:hypothetical protein FB451DRAFT_1341070 [Mycena latifolia]
MHEVYGSGLLLYPVFCDAQGIQERLASYYYGFRAWHFLHSVPWSVEQAAIDPLLKAAATLAPTSSKRKKRLPYTVEGACLTSVFYSIARVGEFTGRTLTSFDPTIHVTRSNMRRVSDRNGLQHTAFSLPRTKSAPNGEDAFRSDQNGLADPEQALNDHFASAFLKRLHAVFASAKFDLLQSHDIRIGATLEYLLRGVSFDVVKSTGRWAGEAFTVYLRKHAQIYAG